VKGKKKVSMSIFSRENGKRGRAKAQGKMWTEESRLKGGSACHHIKKKEERRPDKGVPLSITDVSSGGEGDQRPYPPP